MRSFNIYIFFTTFLIYFLTGYTSFCQPDEHLVFRKIDEQNGLSDNNVQCIYKDKNNFVWIGTASGLNLMNGSDISIFKHESKNKNSISNNNITAITGDSNGLIWIGTQQGLNSLDPFTRKFKVYPLPNSSNIKNDFIHCLVVDKMENLFIGTLNGLFFYDRKIKNIIAIEIPGNKKDSIKNNSITRLAIDPAGILWITTYNGLWSYHIKTHQFIHEINNGGDPLFNNLIIDHSGKIWIGTWDKGLIEFDPSTKKITNHTNSSSLVVTALAEIKQTDGNYILWLNGNLPGFDPSKNKFISFPAPPNFSSSLLIDNLYTSKDNWLWIGTHDGLYFYNPAKTLFRQHPFPEAITSQAVSLLEWNNKMLVSGSGKYFLKAYNDNLFVTDDYASGINNENISCLSLKFSGANTIKAGTNEGIADINLVTHHIHLNHLDFFKKNIASGNFITNLLEDKNHYWWVFPWRKGIWITDSSYNNFHQVFNNFLSYNGNPKPLVIADAVKDKNGNIWFADLDEGIIFYNRSTNTFSKPFTKQLGKRNSMTQILCNYDYFFSFSGTTIYRWHTDSLLLQKISLPPQLDKDISSIALDSIGNLWIATHKGLLVYNFNTKVYEHFTTADGLINNDMDGTLYCRKNGTMFFGSPDYITSFQPARMLNSIDDRPQLILAGVLAAGTPIFFDTTKRMSFGYSVNNFIFKWAVTDYNNPLNNHYYYQLKGIDKEWRYAGTWGEVEFANLSPGNYTLLLKGENSNEVNANKILVLHFEILLPFWRTWWFLGVLFLLIGFIFYTLYRYRLNQVLKIEKLRNKISLDLHDDIGSTLSSISILSEMALHQQKESETKKMLSEIKENSLSLMDRMDDIVWSINPHNDSLESLFLRIKTFAAKLFEAKEINYKIHIDDNIKHIQILMEYRQHIYLIMKEAINNLAKYSSCTEAEINVSFHSSQLNILIKDNGKGFDDHNSSFGNGLNSMRKRAKEMNASLTILSKINMGTTIRLSLKIK